MSEAAFRKIAFSFPDVVELPHFEKTSFRIRNKIFATYDAAHHRCCVLLTTIDQAAFCSFDKSICYPVPNKWGAKGATFIELANVDESFLVDALQTAYDSKKAKK